MKNRRLNQLIRDKKQIEVIDLENFNNQCYKCKSKKNLHLHHLNYDNLYYEEFEKDIILLCKNCHNKEHANKENM